jgi:PAS domain S-box-containing protein
MSQQVSPSINTIPAVSKAARLFLILDATLKVRAFNVFTSAKVLKHTGLVLTDHESVIKYVPRDKRATVKKMLKKVLSGVTIGETAFYIGSENKNVGKPVLYSPVFDLEGHITGVSIHNPPSRAGKKKSREFELIKKDKTPEDPIQNHELYNYVRKASFDAIWDWNLANNTLFYGEGFEVLFGYKTENQTTDISFRNENIHPDDRERVTLGLQKAIQGKDSMWMDEYRFKRSNGQYAYVIDRGIIIRDELGTAFRIIGAMQNITVMKESEIQVKKNRDKLTTILESITDGFVTINREHIVTYWNKEAEKMLGLPRKKVLGNNLRELFRASGEGRFYEVFNTAMNENKTFHFEDYFSRKKIWLEGSIYPSNDGLSVFFRDMSRRKEYDEKLQRERNLLRILIDNIPDYIYVKDTHLKNVINNKTKEASKNKPGFDYFDATLEEKYQEDERRVLNSGIPIINKEEVISTKEGNHRWLLTTKMPLKDDNGRVMGIVGISRDITDAKRSETLLKELNASLEQRAAELVASNLELERFAYVASHDLQEPLRMVSSFLQLLKKKYQGQLDEKAEQYIFFAVDGAERMKKLIMDLLEYSRIGSSKEGYSLTDLNLVGRDVVSLFNDIIEKTGATITFGELPVIKTNKTQVIQLFQNLVSNALKYRSGEKPEITIRAEEQRDHWLFSVKDNGMGIDARYFEKIFIIFQRLHSKSDFSGTGIGLAICKKIIEKHGGMIWVESVPGTGSTFYFTISKYL